MFLGNLFPGLTKFLKLFQLIQKSIENLLSRLLLWQFVLVMGPDTKIPIQSIYLLMSEAEIYLECLFFGLLSKAEFSSIYLSVPIKKKNNPLL